MQNERGKDLKKHDAQVKKLLDEIEAQKKHFEKKGMVYTALDEEQVRAKLNRVNSPMIVAQGWGSTVPAGSQLSYTVSIHNPDPGGWVWLFAHVFVGPANPISSPGEALVAIDSRFPRLTQPEFSGLSLAGNESKSLTFSLAVPGSIEPSNYQGNTFLYQANWHDVGTYFDRSTFVFKVN